MFVWVGGGEVLSRTRGCNARLVKKKNDKEGIHFEEGGIFG